MLAKGVLNRWIVEARGMNRHSGQSRTAYCLLKGGRPSGLQSFIILSNCAPLRRRSSLLSDEVLEIAEREHSAATTLGTLCLHTGAPETALAILSLESNRFEVYINEHGLPGGQSISRKHPCSYGKCSAFRKRKPDSPPMRRYPCSCTKVI